MNRRVHSVSGVNPSSMKKFLVYLFGKEKVYKVIAQPGKLVAWVSQHINKEEARRLMEYWKKEFFLEIEFIRMKDQLNDDGE